MGLDKNRIVKTSSRGKENLRITRHKTRDSSAPVKVLHRLNRPPFSHHSTVSGGFSLR